MDPLTDLLGRAGATGSLFAQTAMHGHGGVGLPAEQAPLAVHVVGRGQLWAHTDAATIAMAEGDVLLVRAPAAIDILAGLHERATPLATLLAINPAPGGGGAGAVVRQIALAGDGPPSSLLCGAYSLAGSICRRLLDALPPVVHVPAATARPALRLLIDLLVAELASGEAGQQNALDRILDLLLVHVLRAHFGSPDAAAPPWFDALADPGVGAALRALHADPGRGWTVAQLAREAGMSRAVFARRFADLVGEPPVAYLTGWRMELAREALRRDGSTLAAVAREVGYANEFAFSAAFTRLVGEPPSRWRSRVRAAAG